MSPASSAIAVSRRRQLEQNLVRGGSGAAAMRNSCACCVSHIHTHCIGAKQVRNLQIAACKSRAPPIEESNEEKGAKLGCFIAFGKSPQQAGRPASTALHCQQTQTVHTALHSIWRSCCEFVNTFLQCKSNQEVLLFEQSKESKLKICMNPSNLLELIENTANTFLTLTSFHPPSCTEKRRLTTRDGKCQDDANSVTSSVRDRNLDDRSVNHACNL